jgi:hypothetical protein
MKNEFKEIFWEIIIGIIALGIGILYPASGIVISAILIIIVILIFSKIKIFKHTRKYKVK